MSNERMSVEDALGISIFGIPPQFTKDDLQETIGALRSLGFAIVRDPEHAPEAVEAADLAFSDEPWLVPAREAMTAAITAYIEHARK